MLALKRSNSLSIKTVGPFDLGRLARLHQSCFDDPWSRADLAHLLALPGGFGLLARLFERNLAGLDGMRGVGFALCRVMRDEGELLSIGVGPVYRRRAIGSALLRESMERCRRAGAVDHVPRGRDRQPVGADALPLVRLRRGRRARGLLPARRTAPGSAPTPCAAIWRAPGEPPGARARRLALSSRRRGASARAPAPCAPAVDRSLAPGRLRAEVQAHYGPGRARCAAALSSGSPALRRMQATSPAAMFSSNSLVFTKVNGQASAEISKLYCGFVHGFLPRLLTTAKKRLRQ